MNEITGWLISCHSEWCDGEEDYQYIEGESKMPSEKNITEMKRFVDALTDALGSSEEQSLEEVKEDLQDAGINVDASVRSLMESVKMISMTAAKKYSNQSGTNRS